MSKLIAEVTNIQNEDNLNIVAFSCVNTTLKMMSLDLNKTIKKGVKVNLACKPTAIAIAKNIKGELSYSNQLNATIIEVEMGHLLCALKLQFDVFVLESIITADSARRLRLTVGDAVIALIKSTDLSIASVL
jgi:molybdopterin-binding protein